MHSIEYVFVYGRKTYLFVLQYRIPTRRATVEVDYTYRYTPRPRCFQIVAQRINVERLERCD
jgi:hypothetical protein